MHGLWSKLGKEEKGVENTHRSLPSSFPFLPSFLPLLLCQYDHNVHARLPRSLTRIEGIFVISSLAPSKYLAHSFLLPSRPPDLTRLHSIQSMLLGSQQPRSHIPTRPSIERLLPRTLLSLSSFCRNLFNDPDDPTSYHSDIPEYEQRKKYKPNVDTKATLAQRFYLVVMS
jgi:hypothetical protein